jgi:hypothetical protein
MTRPLKLGEVTAVGVFLLRTRVLPSGCVLAADLRARSAAPTSVGTRNASSSIAATADVT